MRSAFTARMTSVEGFLDVIAAGNPHLETMLTEMRTRNPIPETSHTHEDKEEVRRRSREFFDELHNNNLSFFFFFLFCIINLILKFL